MEQFIYQIKQFIYQINMWQGINEDIAGCWAKRAIIASEPYTGHRHTLTNYVSIHKQLGKHKKKISTINNKAGFSQEGSFLAEKMEKDDNRAVLEQTCKADFEMAFGSEQALYMNAFSCSLLGFDTCPRTETSTEKLNVL